ncbi:MAG: polymer-forming cytoskeletal protein [bacterium]|nr:polymer-forming cytoskeletal protein [bacterium]
MSKNTHKSGKDALNTVVGKNSTLEGSFEVHDGIRVDGTLKGQLISSGTLVVGPSGIVEADPIRVQDAVIAGKLTGKLKATHQVKLESSAVLIGDIAARVLIIEEGAVFRGFCDAGEDPGVELKPDVQTQQDVSTENESTPAKKAVG